jgi:hypothetical protein
VSSGESSGVRVTLEIYSGRENPSWELAGDTLETVRTRVRELGAAGGGTEGGRHPVLGYRGFLIEGLETPAGETIFVGRGIVTIARGKEARHERDASGLEAVLLADAATHGHGELLRAAGAPQPPAVA